MPQEVFDHPTVKEVAFEIRFSPLFSIENKIGDFQDKIISLFPDSSLIFQRPLAFVDVGGEGKIENLPESVAAKTVKKIWSFKSPNQIEVKVQTNSIAISSHKHKTYNNPNYEEKLKDTIKFVIDNFLQIINIPIIKRIGLRYIDECPLPIKDNTTLNNWYNSAFCSSRFKLEDTQSYYLNVTTNRKKHKLTYQEQLIKNEIGDRIILDFDSFENEIPSKDYLTVTDELYEIVSEEYTNMIKDPLRNYMRTGNLS